MTWPYNAVMVLVFGPPLVVLAFAFWAVVGLIIADYVLPSRDLGLDKGAQVIRLTEPIRLRPTIQKLWAILDD